MDWSFWFILGLWNWLIGVILSSRWFAKYFHAEVILWWLAAIVKVGWVIVIWDFGFLVAVFLFFLHLTIKIFTHIRILFILGSLVELSLSVQLSLYFNFLHINRLNRKPMISFFLRRNNRRHLFLYQLFDQILLQILMLLKLYFGFGLNSRFLFFDAIKLFLKITRFRIISAVIRICLNILIHEIFLNYFYFCLLRFCHLAPLALLLQELVLLNFFWFFYFNEFYLRSLFGLNEFAVVDGLLWVLDFNCFSNAILWFDRFVKMILHWGLSSLMIAYTFLDEHFFVICNRTGNRTASLSQMQFFNIFQFFYFVINLLNIIHFVLLRHINFKLIQIIFDWGHFILQLLIFFLLSDFL